MMPKLPEKLQDQPELVAAVIDARRVQMETEDTGFAMEWLMEHYSMTVRSAAKVLNDETFQYPGLYPEGHPGLEALRAEQRVASRRAYGLKKLRVAVIDRDDSRCQGCNERVTGRDATLDHKDPEGPETLENIHLLCQSCNAIKGKKTWVAFLEEKERFTRIQNERTAIICKATGLSIQGRSFKEAGCEGRSFCLFLEGCELDDD